VPFKNQQHQNCINIIIHISMCFEGQAKLSCICCFVLSLDLMAGGLLMTGGCKESIHVRWDSVGCDDCMQVWEVRPTTKPKTYTFFYADDTICAARSSAGGLSLIAAL
jgi:hypothetical protein